MESCSSRPWNRAETTESRESDSPGDRDDRARDSTSGASNGRAESAEHNWASEIDLFSGYKSDEIVALPATSAPVNAKVSPGRSRGSARSDNAWQRARVC